MINVYAVLDRVTGRYGQPIFMPAPVGTAIQFQHAGAVRWFNDAITKWLPPESNRVGGDYALYFIGCYDDIVGMLIGEEKPFFLSCPGEGLEVKKDE